jgi:hypothetical protein
MWIHVTTNRRLTRGITNNSASYKIAVYPQVKKAKINKIKINKKKIALHLVRGYRVRQVKGSQLSTSEGRLPLTK